MDPSALRPIHRRCSQDDAAGNADDVNRGTMGQHIAVKYPHDEPPVNSTPRADTSRVVMHPDSDSSSDEDTDAESDTADTAASFRYTSVRATHSGGGSSPLELEEDGGLPGIRINTVTHPDAIPRGIPRTVATALLQARAVAPFTSWLDVQQRVKGIGPSRVQTLKAIFRIDGSANCQRVGATSAAHGKQPTPQTGLPCPDVDLRSRQWACGSRSKTWVHRKNTDMYTGRTRRDLMASGAKFEVDHCWEVQIVNVNTDKK